MSFVAPSQYIESLDEFVAHWAQVNASFGYPIKEIVLRGGYNRAKLEADRVALAAALTAVQIVSNTEQLTAADRDIKKAALKERLRQFKAMVQGQLADTSYASVLPKTPQISAAPGTWMKAFDDMAGLWQTVNAAPPPGFVAPLTLAGGYGLASFSSELLALKTTFTVVTNAGRDATLKRRERDVIATAVRTRLREYCKSVAGLFPSGHALLETLPAL